MKNITSKLGLVLGTMILLTPAALVAQNPHAGGSSSHMRPVLFHDRTPRPHIHTVAPHH